MLVVDSVFKYKAVFDGIVGKMGVANAGMFVDGVMDRLIIDYKMSKNIDHWMI